MIRRNDILNKWQGISEGTPVYTQDGEKLGKVRVLGEDSFVIEKGFFFPKDFYARYDDVVDVRDDTIYLSQAREAFDEYEGRYEVTPRDEFRDRYPDWSRTNERIPLAEEELQVNKTQKQTGDVKLRKIVHTEYRHFTVPVMREEVRIERTPVTGERAEGLRTDASFKEDTISVPVMEEEVTVTKRPVVKEEVSLHKERVEEQREVSGEVRREDIVVDDKSKKRTA
jgi:uncharacterized protein (TIGR02271 family)